SRRAGAATAAAWIASCWRRPRLPWTSWGSHLSADRHRSSKRWPARSWTSATIRSGSRPSASAQQEDEMEALKLDGTAAAGLRQEVVAPEITTAVGTCDNCGTAGAVGGVSLYKGPGMVLRCPHCNSVLVKVVTDGTRIWLNAGGLRALEL